MNLDESVYMSCDTTSTNRRYVASELGYKCDIHGVLSCDTRCTISSSQSTVESPNTVVDKTLCQISRSRVSKKMSKPICAQECDLYFWMSKSTNDLMCTVYNNFALHLRTMTSKSVTLTLVHLKVCRKS